MIGQIWGIREGLIMICKFYLIKVRYHVVYNLPPHLYCSTVHVYSIQYMLNRCKITINVPVVYTARDILI
jgi:hypothetical protein